MSVDYTVTQLLSDVKRQATIPESNNLYTDTRLVDVLDDNLRNVVVPFVIRTRQDYFVAYEDFTVIDGTKLYSIPRRAFGNRLKDVVLVNSDGTDGPQIPLVSDPRSYHRIPKNSGYVLKGHQVELWPDEKYLKGETFRMYYYTRPSRLVELSKGAKVQSINSGSGEVTVEVIPGSWTTSFTYDAVKNKPDFETVDQDLVVTDITSNVMTLDSLPSALEVGDYLTESNETVIAQLPYELFPLLTKLAALEVVSSLGDARMMTILERGVEKITGTSIDIIVPRVDDESETITSDDGLFNSM